MNKSTKKNPPSSLWHYTSFEVLMYILAEDDLKNGEMSFWFSNPLQTNDKKEVNFFREYVFKGKGGRYLEKEVSKMEEKVGYPFTLSLIYHKEDKKTYKSAEIPMWKMYGNNFSGVRLRFKFDKLNKYCQGIDSLDLADCEYLTKTEMNEKGQNIRKTIPVGSSTTDLETIYKKSVRYKTYDWIYENEWRLVKWTKDINTIKARPADGRLYLPLKLPIDLLEAIEIGSKADQTAVEGYLHLLKRKFSNNEEIHFSILKSKLEIGYI